MNIQKMVEDNFKGLDAAIGDKDLSKFYKELIATCVENYASCDDDLLIIAMSKVKELFTYLDKSGEDSLLPRIYKIQFIKAIEDALKNKPEL